jgi:thiamine biosynthesis lipoprotein
LNARSGKWVRVSTPLWLVIEKALQLAQETGGLFDPTLLTALETAGYQQSFIEMGATKLVETDDGMDEGMSVLATKTTLNGRYQDVKLNNRHHAVYLPPDVRLDLGGIGKGYTAHQVVDRLSRLGPCLVDAGGDLTAGAPPAEALGWPVGIAAPWSETGSPDTLLRLWLANGSLATSGIDYRHWQKNGRPQHHIIDPRTGFPAETNVITVTVKAEDACVAETWATAALVAGIETGGALLHARHMAAAFIDVDWQVSVTPALVPQVQVSDSWF